MPSSKASDISFLTNSINDSGAEEWTLPVKETRRRGPCVRKPTEDTQVLIEHLESLATRPKKKPKPKVTKPI